MTVFSVKTVMGFVCIVAAQCNAAPSVAADPNQASDAAELTPLGSTAGRAAAGSDSKQLDLLLQMQQRSAGISFNERVRRGADTTDTRARLAAAPLGSSQADQPTAVPPAPSGLFGSGATPTVNSQRSAAVSSMPHTPTGPVYSDTGRGGSVSSGSSSELSRWLHVPRDIVDYIRDNRATFIGSVVALSGLMWLGSILFTSRRS